MWTSTLNTAKFQSTLPKQEVTTSSKVNFGNYKFQSTLPKQEVTNQNGIKKGICIFQSTLPKQEVTTFPCGRPLLPLISIHTS